MSKKEARALKRSIKRDEKIQRKYEKVSTGGKFKQWRNKRPFWGATLLLLAGLMILYIPLHLYEIAFIPGSFVFVGFIFGGLLLIIGVLAYIYPAFSTVFGVIGIFLSVLSIMGALGGFIVGTIFGIIAGALLIGWELQEVKPNQDNVDHHGDKNKSIVKDQQANIA